MEKNVKLLIIPDVHGRLFWREPVKNVLENYPQAHIVFLGDYLSPYSYENITHNEAWERFWEIEKLKKENPDRITLLFGNHDASAINTSICSCRYDYNNNNVLHAFFTENLDMFNLVYECKINNKKFFLSHAGIVNNWWKLNSEFFRTHKIKKTATSLNKAFHEGKLWGVLSDVSWTRGGHIDGGSLIWADVIEHSWSLDKNTFKDKIQIFGHSQQWENPVNLNDLNYCLDCRQVFYIDSFGILRFYNTDEMLPITDRDSFFARYL